MNFYLAFKRPTGLCRAEEKNLFCDYPMNLICMNEPVEYPFQNKDVRDLFLITQSLYRDGGRGLAEGEMRCVSTKVAYTAAAITGTLDVYGEMILREACCLA